MCIEVSASCSITSLRSKSRFRQLKWSLGRAGRVLANLDVELWAIKLSLFPRGMLLEKPPLCSAGRRPAGPDVSEDPHHPVGPRLLRVRQAADHLPRAPLAGDGAGLELFAAHPGDEPVEAAGPAR